MTALPPAKGQECPREVSAIRRADAMARKAVHAGALAFKRRGDPNIGSFNDATILKAFGDIPRFRLFPPV
ncbi:MAG: hypothetical protein ACXU84_06720 [Xanthobacteraceae bacterium]